MLQQALAAAITGRPKFFWVSREGSALWLMRGISPHNVTDMGISAMIKPVEGAGALVSGIA